MKKYIIIITIGCCLLSCNQKSYTSKQQTTTQKPNIIFIITDDQGYGDLGHTGNPYVHTPAIDKFSTEAINLTNYHVGTTCSPTRAGIMTGRNANLNGVWHTVQGASILNKDEETIADVFQQNGYKTKMIGKWHLGDNTSFYPHHRGFDEAFYHGGGNPTNVQNYWNNSYFDDTYFRDGVPEKQQGYCTDIWFDEAIDYIKKNKANPFFLYLSTNAPHGPWNVPQKYFDKYKNVNELTSKQQRFYAMIENIDDNFARLEATLDHLGIAENTILIFTTDNGTVMGIAYDKNKRKMVGYNAGMRRKKTSPYDGGHRVPMIIRWPNGGLKGGKALDGLVAHVDVIETLSTLAGIKFNPKKELDGTDVSGYLLGKAEIPNRMLVTDTQRVQWLQKGRPSCVMDGNWRLVNQTELYNITEDVGQENDLASQYPERVKAMNAFYNTWFDKAESEAKFSRVPLGATAHIESLHNHDVHSGDVLPVHNQKKVRSAEFLAPSPFYVDVVSAGQYRFTLRRWPKESSLALGDAANDTVKDKPWRDGRALGKAIAFTNAHVKIAGKEAHAEVDTKATSVIMELRLPKGETELTAWFDTTTGDELSAYYVDVEKLN